MNSMMRGVRDWLCRAPYDGVIWFSWLYIIGAFYYANGGALQGNLIWFDDNVRMVQALDFINGHSWYDRTITRVNAPEGFHTIWSRLVDLPIVAVILSLQHFIGQHRAALQASIIIPLLQTLGLFYAGAYVARPLVGRRRAKLAALFILFGSCINIEYFTLAGFHPGGAGHHAWYVLLVLVMWGTMARLALRSNPKDRIITSVAIALLLTIGIEALPLIAGSFAILGFIAWRGERVSLARDALLITSLAALLGLLLLPVNQPPVQCLMISFAEPSILGPLLIALTAFFFAIEYALLRHWQGHKILTLLALTATALLLATGLIITLPGILHGPAAALTTEERMLARAEHTEAMTLWRVSLSTLDYARMIITSLLALAIGLASLRHATPRAQRLRIFLIGLVILTLALASYLSRFFHYAQLAACPWLLYGWAWGWRHFRRDTAYSFKNFLLFVALGPLWLLIVPSIVLPTNFANQFLLFPAKREANPQSCDVRSVARYINAHYPPDTLAIVPIYLSSKFLFQTDIRIFFLASFPSQNKFIEAKNFYGVTGPDVPRQIASKHGIDLVAICKGNYEVNPNTQFANSIFHKYMGLGQKLAIGDVPDWLHPIKLPEESDYLLFAVNKDAVAR